MAVAGQEREQLECIGVRQIVVEQDTVRRRQLRAVGQCVVRQRRFDELVDSDAFLHLPVDRHHAISAGLLDGAHRDPFDRVIAAQALIENLTVITRDRAFADFGCKVAW